MVNMIPDYSNIYFPPPPGASSSNPPHPSSVHYLPPGATSSPPSSFSTHRPPPPGVSPLQNTTRASQPPGLQPPHQRSAQPSPSLETFLPPSRSKSPAFRTQFASLSLHHTDRIRFLRFPPTLIPLIRATILSAWPRGIQSESEAEDQRDFKLKGRPWEISRGEVKAIRGAFGEKVEEQGIHAQRLISSLLAALHGEGWMLMLTTDVSNVLWDADTLLFRHQSPCPATCEWFSVNFSTTHRLRFVDAPSSLCMSVINHFSKGKMEIQCKEHRVEGCYDIKFRSAGLTTVTNESTVTRYVLLDLLQCFEEGGWTVYASMNQSTAKDNDGMTDTWYCCRPAGWAQGAPVYHK